MTILFIATQQGDSTNREPESPSERWSLLEAMHVRPRTAKWFLLGEHLSIPSQEGAFARWTMDESLRAVRQFVSDNIGNLPEVVKVIANVDEDLISICTIIDSADRTARYRVYEAERKVLAKFPRLSFDFRVVNLKNFAGASAAVLSAVEGETLYDKLGMVSNDEVQRSFTGLPGDVSYAYM